jgi:hypothetical protein
MVRVSLNHRSVQRFVFREYDIQTVIEVFGAFPWSNADEGAYRGPVGSFVVGYRAGWLVR